MSIELHAAYPCEKREKFSSAVLLLLMRRHVAGCTVQSTEKGVEQRKLEKIE